MHLSKVMFDSGSLHASYIDPKIVSRYRKWLKSKITAIRGSVTLGDSRITHEVSEAVDVKLEFRDDNGSLHTGMVNLVVFETGSHIIIGLPDIARVFGDLFMLMVRTAMDNPALLFENCHAPLVRVITGPSLHSLCFWDSEDDSPNPHNRDKLESIVYQESVDGSEFDPVDSDLWMDT